MMYFNLFRAGFGTGGDTRYRCRFWDSLSRASLIEFTIPTASARGNPAKWSVGEYGVYSHIATFYKKHPRKMRADHRPGIEN